MDIQLHHMLGVKTMNTNPYHPPTSTKKPLTFQQQVNRFRPSSINGAALVVAFVGMLGALMYLTFSGVK